MQMCSSCDRVYDESEYCRCPYCSGELEPIMVERNFKNCPNCDSYMLWEEGEWGCVNCGYTIEAEDDDDCDGTIEVEEYY